MEKFDKLLEYGQSYWLDNLSREIITNGELENRIKNEGLRGITSNPSIFNKVQGNVSVPGYCRPCPGKVDNAHLCLGKVV